MSGARIAKRLYSALLPKMFRESKFAKAAATTILPHNVIYDGSYFEREVAPAAARAAPTICASILNKFNPRRVVDVGCGTGELLECFRRAGRSVVGLEYADAAIAKCRERGLSVRKFDLEREEMEVTEKFDLVISMEVAEHLPAASADRYVALLTSLADTIVFTAATPGQGGTDHVNEQPATYWIDKFERRGLALDSTLSNQWKHDWEESGNVKDWYFCNLMVFSRAK